MTMTTLNLTLADTHYT